MNPRYRVLSIILSAFACMSCTVKEDRVICPCFLSEEFCKVNAGLVSGEPWISIMQGKGRTIEQGSIHGEMMREGQRYVSKVPKQFIDVCVLYGNVHGLAAEDPDTMVYAAGFESDSIYAHCATVDCTRETASDTVMLFKQWCTLTVVISGSEAWKPYWFELRGAWNGIDLHDLSPIKGAFRCIPRKTGSSTYEGRIPRQGDDTLTLQVYDTDAFGLPSELRFEYPIGAKMAATGYDWKERWLRDARITIDYATADVYVEIAGWDDGQNFNDITI